MSIYDDTDSKTDARMEQIIDAIKNKDTEMLKSLFSQKALAEADDFDSEADSLFGIIQGNVESGERDGISSDITIEHGKKTVMARFGLDIKTDKDTYHFYVIDYITDTIDPDNEGVYMLELIEYTDQSDLQAWQNRMRAGIYIH